MSTNFDSKRIPPDLSLPLVHPKAHNDSIKNSSRCSEGEKIDVFVHRKVGLIKGIHSFLQLFSTIIRRINGLSCHFTAINMNTVTPQSFGQSSHKEGRMTGAQCTVAHWS